MTLCVPHVGHPTCFGYSHSLLLSSFPIFAWSPFELEFFPYIFDLFQPLWIIFHLELIFQFEFQILRMRIRKEIFPIFINTKDRESFETFENLNVQPSGAPPLGMHWDSRPREGVVQLGLLFPIEFSGSQFSHYL